MKTNTKAALKLFEAACDSMCGVSLDLVTAEQVDLLKNLAKPAEVSNILIALTASARGVAIENATYISCIYRISNPHEGSSVAGVFNLNGGANVIFDPTTATWIVLDELKLLYNEGLQMNSDEDNEIFA